MVVLAANGRVLGACIPGSRPPVVPGGGHLFVVERPADITDLDAGFLRRT